MTEDIRKAVIRAISEKFQLPVYGQVVPQGGKKPCFTVELAGLEQKRLLGNRAARKATFEVNYFCGEGKITAAEGIEAVDGLYEVLLIIGEDEKFAASGMKHEKTADGVKFMAEYEYHIIFTEDKAELMQRLEYNGKEAVGYEEE
ncbi:phage tail terminator family protein [Anaerotignum sp.]